MAFGSLLSLCLVVSSTFANPIQIRSSPITLPIATKINAVGGAKAVIARDQARARALYAHGLEKVSGKSFASVPVPVTDAAVNIFLHLVPCAINNNSPISKSTPRALVSVLERIHSSWTQGVPIPGSVPDKHTSLVRIPRIQEIRYRSLTAVVVSRAKNVNCHPSFSSNLYHGLLVFCI